MENFVAYHSASRRGGPYRGGANLSFYCKKPESYLRKIIGQSLWVIASTETKPFRYLLRGVYTPSHIQPDGVEWHITGKGMPFKPPIDVTALAWFNKLRVEQVNFSFGLNRIRSSEVIRALGRYRNANGDTSAFPDELSQGNHFEGSGTKVTVNRYERDWAARATCLRKYGTSCYICKTNLEDVYGAIAAGLIHVHHLTPISAIGREYKLDPIRDLVPICPNCHAVAHRRDPPFSPEEIRAQLRRVPSSRRAPAKRTREEA